MVALPDYDAPEIILGETYVFGDIGRIENFMLNFVGMCSLRQLGRKIERIHE